MEIPARSTSIFQCWNSGGGVGSRPEAAEGAGRFALSAVTKEEDADGVFLPGSGYGCKLRSDLDEMGKIHF